MERERLLLASSSPRRQELLRLMGIPFDVYAVSIDEKSREGAAETVKILSYQKACAAMEKNPSRVILAADTVVACGEKVLGKPKNEADAEHMLKLLSGNVNTVYTGVCLINAAAGYCKVCCDKTDVYFSALDDSAITDYIQSGEPMDKAGAYAIQGMGGMFVEKIIGSPSNVIGLPMHLVRRMLEESGWN